jgi:signal peptidase I
VVASHHPPARVLSADRAEGSDEPRRRRLGPALIAGILLLLVLLPGRLFVAEPFEIPSRSMVPTLEPGEHVLADKLAYRFGSPKRGDLVVFHAPRTGEVLLKRVVALPGDRVGIEDSALVVNGRRPSEPYVKDARLIDGEYFGPIRVPRGEVFVLGDRRSDSVDSRTFGPIPESALIGRVDARVWPLDKLRLFR